MRDNEIFIVDTFQMYLKGYDKYMTYILGIFILYYDSEYYKKKLERKYKNK